MDLPWWPIYVDAEVDEAGVQFTGPDGERVAVPWHLVTFNSSPSTVMIIYDEYLKRVRAGRRLVIPRVRGAEWKRVVERAHAYQQDYFAEQSNAYEVIVDARRERRNRWGMVLLTMFVIVGFPSVVLWMILKGLQGIPDNEPGEIFRNSSLLFGAFMALWMVLGTWWCVHGLIQSRRSMRVRTIRHYGVVLAGKDGGIREVPWESMSYARGSGFEFVVDISGTDARFVAPRHPHGWGLIFRHLPRPPKTIVRWKWVKLFTVCLFAGIFAAGWLDYMSGEQDVPFSALVFLAVLPVLCVVVPLGLLVFFGSLSKKKSSGISEDG